MAERLEGLTKPYKVPILLSSNLYTYLTEETANECRQVDYCLMAGAEQPVGLFTVDVDPDGIMLEDEIPQSMKQRKIRRV